MNDRIVDSNDSMERADDRDGPPGYGVLLRRRRYLWENRSKIADPGLRDEMAMLARINNKLRGYEWVRDRGQAIVPHSVHPDIATALRANRANRFVLKPVGGHSSMGVYLLERERQGGYACAMTGRRYASDEALVAHHAKLVAARKGQVTTEVILETYVEDEQGYDVPLDYKVYAFASGTPIIMQRYAPVHLDKSDWGFEFYDESGRRLGPIRVGVSLGDRWGLKPPARLPDLFRMAQVLVAEARVSFVRIDLYSTPSGPVFGEFTPVPNNAKESYVPAFDRILGDLWLQSLEKLGLDYLGSA